MRTPSAAPTGTYRAARLSPDATRVALAIEQDIWVYDIPRGTMSRLTVTSNNFYPLWTADGNKIIFASRRGGTDQIFWIEADGSGEAEGLASGDYDWHPDAVSLDGSLLAFHEHAPETDVDIRILPLEGEHEPRAFLQTEFREYPTSFSPDGRWLAYGSTQSGQNEVYATPYPGPGARIQISTNGGSGAIWSRDGREIFYVEGGDMMAVDVSGDSKLKFGVPHRLFETLLLIGPAWHAYTPMPDGTGFLIAESNEGVGRSLQIVLDWFAEIEQLVPSE